MSPEKNKAILSNKSRPAVALVITLVILVALSTVAYSVYARLAAQRHRDQYLIDYTAARYAADSGLKYALTFIETIEPKLISRPNEPDFSDVFNLSEEEYQELIDEWSSILAELAASNEANDLNDIVDVNEPNDIAYIDPNIFSEVIDPNTLTIRGPYGAPWPLITKKITLEIGSAEVSFDIHDENAKMPICWALITDKEQSREAEAALEIFCEWMEMDKSEIKNLKAQMKQIAEIKSFKFYPKPKKGKKNTSNSRRINNSKYGKSPKGSKPPVSGVSPHIIDWTRLLHSVLLNTEMLAKPIVESENRRESALKYLCLWGSETVNINTAPRHVLEAAFTFGGDADKIAEEIIQRRQRKPYKDMRDFKTSLLTYADSITKAERYITTKSDFFTVRVTARSGVAKASTVASIIKNEKKVQKLAVITE